MADETQEKEYYRNCLDCIFHYEYIHSCNYIFVTGHPRGCSGGDGCEKKIVGKRKPGTQAYKIACELFDKKPRHEPSARQRERERRFALWKQGLNDSEIADACGVSQAAISQFRRFNHLPPNADNQGHKIKHDWEKYKL